MNRGLWDAAAVAALLCAGVAAAAEPETWTFKATAYPTQVRGGDNYTSGIITADRGALHLEARSNYESVGTRSFYAGWKFSGGDTLSWEITPILGVARGNLHATVPGVEWSLAWKNFDFYSESQYVRDRSAAREDSYIYSWNELGFSAAEWLRLGLAVQRTRAYGGDRDIQRGPFLQLTAGRVTLGGYWFNPGASEQVFVGSIGVAF